MTPRQSCTAPIQEHIDGVIHDLLVSFPDPEQLSPDERRGIIARYTAVLEGNFIYWMTAAYLSVASEEAHSVIRDNLLEEVRDNHPGMMRKFAMAADAFPTDSDALAVHRMDYPLAPATNPLEGVEVLLALIQNIVHPRVADQLHLQVNR